MVDQDKDGGGPRLPGNIYHAPEIDPAAGGKHRRANIKPAPGRPAETPQQTRSREAHMRRAVAEAKRLHLIGKWAHKNEGTPETHEHAARVRQSPLSRMVRLGKITVDELAAAVEIADVIESIESGVGFATMNLERVDNGGAGRDALVEGLKRVRMEVAYKAWRQALPTPKRMIIDMLVSDVTYVRQAARYGMHYRTARKRLITALRMWPTFKDLAVRMVDRDDLDAAHARLMGERR